MNIYCHQCDNRYTCKDMGAPMCPVCSCAKWRLLSIKQTQAHTQVAKAKKLGIIHQQPCAVCGSIKSEAHHADYSKPLEVVWLCRKHHRIETATIKRLESVCE